MKPKSSKKNQTSKLPQKSKNLLSVPKENRPEEISENPARQRDFDDKDQNLIRHTMIQRRISLKLPSLPDPTELKNYNKVESGFAERLLKNYEKDEANRRNLKLIEAWTPIIIVGIFCTAIGGVGIWGQVSKNSWTFLLGAGLVAFSIAIKYIKEIIEIRKK